jgi:hypothetical protein
MAQKELAQTADLNEVKTRAKPGCRIVRKFFQKPLAILRALSPIS